MITTGLWDHVIGLQGELQQYFTDIGSARVPWDNDWQRHKGTPLSWYRIGLAGNNTDVEVYTLRFERMTLSDLACPLLVLCRVCGLLICQV